MNLHNQSKVWSEIRKEAAERMSKELGRRVSKGEYERRTTKYINLPAPYLGMVILDPECPRAVRKQKYNANY